MSQRERKKRGRNPGGMKIDKVIQEVNLVIEQEPDFTTNVETPQIMT